MKKYFFIFVLLSFLTSCSAPIEKSKTERAKTVDTEADSGKATAVTNVTN